MISSPLVCEAECVRIVSYNRAVFRIKVWEHTEVTEEVRLEGLDFPDPQMDAARHATIVCIGGKRVVLKIAKHTNQFVARVYLPTKYHTGRCVVDLPEIRDRSFFYINKMLSEAHPIYDIASLKSILNHGECLAIHA